MTAVLIFVAIIAGIILLAGIVALALAYAYEEDPRADEIHVVTTSDGWKIRLCRYRATSGEGEPVLVVHGLCGNQFNLAIPDGHSLIDYLSRHGFDCWAIDLRGDRSSRGPSGVSRNKATLEGCVTHDIPAAIDFIRGATGMEQVHWVGHSLGGLVYYAYEQIHGPDALSSVCTLGTPPRLGALTMPRAEMLKSVGLPLVKYVPGVCEYVLRNGAPLLKPFKIETVSFPINWDNVHPALTSGELYNLVELPSHDFFLTLHNWTVEGSWRVRNGEIDVQQGLSDLKTPLLSIYGAADPLAPAALGEQFVGALKQSDKGLLILSEANGFSADYNHIDLAIGKNGDREVFEPIRQWLADHAAGAMPRPSASSPAARLLAEREDTSWRRALRRAAKVMDDFSGDVAMDEEPVTASAPRPVRKALKARPTKKAAKTKVVSKKKKTAAKSPKPKPKKKTAAKKATKSAKKPAAKTKPNRKTPATNSKPKAAKKKTTAKKPQTRKAKAAKRK